MFFTFDQSNPGGTYIGPKHVIIEAPSAKEANERAVVWAGIHFDELDDSDAYDVPSIYDTDITLALSDVDAFIEESAEFLAQFSGWSLPNFIIHWNNGTSQSVIFTEAQTERAKQLVREKTPTVWGWQYYVSWDEPSEVFQAWQSDYDETEFWDESGNLEVVVRKSGPGFVKKGDWLYFSANTEEEAIREREAFMEDILDAVDARKKANPLIKKKMTARKKRRTDGPV